MTFISTKCIINNFENIFWSITNTIISNFRKQYGLKLDSYFYEENQKIYILVLRLRNKRINISLSIQHIYADKSILELLHPIDAHIIGIIAGMHKNSIIYNNREFKNFRDYNDYHVMKPIIELVYHDMTENLYDNLLIKPIAGGNPVRVSILELSRNPFLLQALGSSTAARIGFFISDYFAEQEGYCSNTHNQPSEKEQSNTALQNFVKMIQANLNHLFVN